MQLPPASGQQRMHDSAAFDAGAPIAASAACCALLPRHAASEGKSPSDVLACMRWGTATRLMRMANCSSCEDVDECLGVMTNVPAGAGCQPCVGGSWKGGAHLLLMEGLGNHVPGDSQLVAGIACQYLSVDIAYYMITCYNT